jgi:hypothetical protein
MPNNCGCGCNTGCNTCPQTNPCATKCKSQITSADLAELVYIAGLDVNLCKKYSTIIDAMGLVDCNGNPIGAGTAIVTCPQFQAELCELLSALTTGAPVAPGTVLVGADCLKHVMPAFQVPLTFNDTTCITLDVNGNIVTATPVISPTPGNTLTCTANGLMSNVCTGIESLPDGSPVATGTELIGADCQVHAMPAFQAPLTFSDTSCIDLTVTGNVVTATPIISPAADNQLTCTAQGLFVQETVVPAETPITANDTTTVDLTASGTANHTLVANVRISDNTGQAIEVNSEGLYVPDLCTQLADIGGLVTPAEPGDVFVTVGCEPRTIPVNGGILVDDTQTIDLTLTGNTITGDVIVSSVPNNLIEVRPDGLAVRVENLPGVTMTAVDTNCLNLEVTEAPANTFTITGNPIVSPTAGNQLSCSANGLFVAPQAAPVIAPTASGFPANCNGLVAQGDGLAAPPNATGNRATSFTNSILVNEEMTSPDTVSSATFTVNIENPSDCRDAILVVEMMIPQIATSGIQPGVFAVELNVYHSFNLPGILVAPMTIRASQQIVDNDTDAVGPRAGNDNTPSTVLTQFTVPPGFVGSYSVMATVTMFGGTGTVLVGNPAAQYFLYTI